jgi:chromate reductase
MPVMQQPEAYVGGLSDSKFGEDGRITDEALAKLVAGIIHAFADWVDLIHAGRDALAPDSSGSSG